MAIPLELSAKRSCLQTSSQQPPHLGTTVWKLSAYGILLIFVKSSVLCLLIGMSWSILAGVFCWFFNFWRNFEKGNCHVGVYTNTYTHTYICIKPVVIRNWVDRGIFWKLQNKCSNISWVITLGQWYPQNDVKRSKAFLHTPDSYKLLTTSNICWNKFLTNTSVSLTNIFSLLNWSDFSASFGVKKNSGNPWTLKGCIDFFRVE